MKCETCGFKLYSNDEYHVEKTKSGMFVALCSDPCREEYRRKDLEATATQEAAERYGKE